VLRSVVQLETFDVSLCQNHEPVIRPAKIQVNYKMYKKEELEH
jgi:hypothetical protein